MQDAINRRKAVRRGQVVGTAALLFIGFGWAHSFGGCKISDWPLGIPEGPDGWVATFRTAAANPPRIVVQEVTQAPRAAGVVPAPANGSAASPARRYWKAGRHPDAKDFERLKYAVYDDDVVQIGHYLSLPGMDLNAPLSANSRLSLLDLAIQFGYPQATRLLIEGGAHLRAEPGEAVDVHPIRTAVNSLESYVHARERPDPFVDRPPRSLESYVATIRVLLDAGADPNEGLTPAASPSPLATLLYTPRFEGDVELARLLLTHGAVADAEGSWPAPIVIAIEKGYVDYVDALLGGRVSSATLNAALIAASRGDELGIAEKLLGHGADPNTVDTHTPLLCAALRTRERRPMALALLVHGANVNAACGSPSNGPYSPLTLVDKSDHELVDLMTNRGGQLAIPQHDQDEYESHGVSAGPIVWSIMHDADYLASKLIARDPHLSNRECGAVVYASRFGATLTLVELFKHGADPNSTSEHGISALMAAAFYDQTSAMRVLLAQPRIDIGQRTPVHANLGFFTSLGLEGSRPPLTIGGRTALAYATLAGSRNAVTLLADRGAR